LFRSCAPRREPIPPTPRRPLDEQPHRRGLRGLVVRAPGGDRAASPPADPLPGHRPRPHRCGRLRRGGRPAAARLRCGADRAADRLRPRAGARMAARGDLPAPRHGAGPAGDAAHPGLPRAVHGGGVLPPRGRTDKAVGPRGMPRIPGSPVPLRVAEYSPPPGAAPCHDPRQHAISLAYVVPLDGEAAPQEDALELTWFGIDELVAESSPLDEMEGGRDLLVRRALAHVGAI